MAQLVWDKTGERLWETGVSHGVIYPYDASTQRYGSGVVWNGLISVTESEDAPEAEEGYADNLLYFRAMPVGKFTGSIEAYTYPDEFAECDGTAHLSSGVGVHQQQRKPFAFSYRSKIGNDVDDENHGYKIHLIWMARAEPSDREYDTVNDSPEAMTFDWDISADTVEHGFEDFRPFADMTIDSTGVDAETLSTLEGWLYGTASSAPRMPSPKEVLELVRYTYDGLLDSNGAAILDNGGSAVLARVMNFK